MAMKKLITLFMICFVFCTPAEAAASVPPFKIGMLVPLMGSGRFKGIAMLAGARAAVEEINNNGGINGQPVELIVKDTKSKAEDLENGALKLIRVDNPSVVIGPPFPSDSNKVEALFQRSRLPLILLTVPNAGVNINAARDGKSYIFRLCDSLNVIPTAFYYELKKRNWTRAALISSATDEKNENNTDIVQMVESVLERVGLKIVVKIEYPDMTYGFSPFFSIALNFKPNVIFFSGDDEQTFLAMKQATLQLPDGVSILTTGPSPAFFWKDYVSELHDECFLSFIDLNSQELREKLRKVKNKEMAKEGTLAPVHAIMAYDAVMWAADARRRSSSDSKLVIRDALASTEDLQLLHRKLTIGSGNGPVGTTVKICSLKEFILNNLF